MIGCITAGFEVTKAISFFAKSDQHCGELEKTKSNLRLLVLCGIELIVHYVRPLDSDQSEEGIPGFSNRPATSKTSLTIKSLRGL